MDRPLASPKACRCCLTTDEKALRFVKNSTHILDLLVGKNLDLAELWLCYRCSHTVRKIYHFRDLCSRAHAVLQEYSTIQDNNKARNYFRGESETFIQRRERELSTSNTLCMSILLERLESPIHIYSFNTNGRPPKNYTNNITRHHEIVSEGNIKLEKEFNCDPLENVIQSDTYPEVPCSNNVFVKNEIAAKSFESGNIVQTENSTLKTLEPLYKIEDINSKDGILDDHSDSYPNETNLSEPLMLQSLPKISSNIQKKLKNPQIHSNSKNTCSKRKIPKTISEEIEKVYAAPLSMEEQMKEKEDRAKEESYLSAAFKCELCVVTFQSRLAMVNHGEKHSESRGPLICPVCSLRFPKFENLSKHRKNHSIRFVCHICEQRFYNRNSLKNHLIWHYGEFKCPECSETFTNKKELKYHATRKHPVKGFQCGTCGKIISTKSLFEIHMQRHRGIPTHLCSICSKGFYSEKNLYLHLETHNTKKPLHYCVECDRHFKSLNILKSHLIYAMPHCDVSVLKHKCTECPRAFRSAVFLAQHTAARHGGPHKYVCDECGVSYATRWGLVKHIKFVHQGYQLPKKFPCTYCEKAFTTKVKLDNHIRVHTGERPFKCSYCPDTFTQTSALGTHIKLVHLKLKRNIKMKKKVDK